MNIPLLFSSETKSHEYEKLFESPTYFIFKSPMSEGTYQEPRGFQLTRRLLRRELVGTTDRPSETHRHPAEDPASSHIPSSSSCWQRRFHLKTFEVSPRLWNGSIGILRCHKLARKQFL